MFKGPPQGKGNLCSRQNIYVFQSLSKRPFSVPVPLRQVGIEGSYSPVVSFNVGPSEPIVSNRVFFAVGSSVVPTLLFKFCF